MERPEGDATTQPVQPVGVRLRAALASLERAEVRGAPPEELRRMEEAVIVARVAQVRAAMRAGSVLTTAEQRQLERDVELLRRFPSDREGDGGLGWFDWPPRSGR